MDIRQITEHFFVAPQIDPADMPRLAEAGFALVLCNRPDTEVPASHQSAALQEAASVAGLAFSVQPLTHQTMTPGVIRANFALIEGANGPVLAYCASGTRSTIAWALGAAGSLSTDDILSAAERAGYNLHNMRPTLDAIAQSAPSA